jgi:hypothetical protein
MEKTAKPLTAGILNIIAGAFGAMGWIIFASIAYGEGLDISEFVEFLAIGLLIPALAIVGGTFGSKRKQWGWALAGSIVSIILFLPLGIASTVLNAQSKGEFE